VSEPFRFELDRLVSYDDRSLIEELQRVAGLVPDAALTRTAFDRIARVDSSTLLKRFGGWQGALERANLADRYSGRRVSERMRVQRAKTLSDEQLLDELRLVADTLGTSVLTREAFRTHSNGVNDASIARRFGSWSEGLRRAGLELSPLGRRWTDDDYFENLLTV
jgi:Homing endonuclease associated repeat